MKICSKITILLVDDEIATLKTESMALEIEGFENVITCSESKNVLTLIKEHNCNIVVLDISMPEISGIQLQEMISENFPDVTILMLTGDNDPKNIVSCIRNGAFDYILKPVDPTRLATSIKKVIEHRYLLCESMRLKDFMLNYQPGDLLAFEKIITRNKLMFDIFKYIEAIAPSKLQILILGETGTGKELFAEAIHKASGAKGEFVIVNCAGIDDNMFSDTIFGHVKNAFTGASTQRDGLIKSAEGGTLFLDEIGDLKKESQIKLLRLLQDGTYYPIGSDRCKKSKTRIIAATNADLEKAVSKGDFRCDLFYRLQAHSITIPPLRKRLEDIPLLLEYFLEKGSKEMEKNKPIIPNGLLELLQNYNFPGNVRELSGIIYNALSHQTTSRKLLLDVFKKAVSNTKKLSSSYALDTNDTVTNKVLFPCPLPTLAQVEKYLVEEALKRTGGNKTIAANLIGVTRKTFSSKLTK